jgi:hypothetical protein
MRILLLLGLVVAGCGGSSDSSATGNCDQPSAQSHTCIDYSGPSDVVTAYKGTCQNTSGSWKDGATCSHAGAVGGCRASNAMLKLTYTTWFYGPALDAATVQQSCQSPDVFVTP